MAMRLIVLVLFLGISASLLMIGPANTAPVASPGKEESSKESSAGPSGWLVAPAAALAPAATAELKKGQRIFVRDCARCHGQRGDGVSSIADTLHPLPFDLTGFELADSFILRVVREGVSGSDMPGWSLGTDEDVRAVTAYTARLSRPDALPVQERYASPAALQEGGKRVYAMHCISCHGAQGSGDGPDAGRYLPGPASFADMRPSFAAARRVIEDGVHGTAMASWPLLNAPEIQAVTFYVRSLYTRSGSTTGARP